MARAKKGYGHPEFRNVLREIGELHEGKNRQYAMPDDPLGNFRRTGQIISKMLKPGLDPTLASCLAFMSKQVDGIYEIFGEDKQDTFDSLEDKALDTAVYSIIAICLIRDRRAARKPQSEKCGKWFPSGVCSHKCAPDYRHLCAKEAAECSGVCHCGAEMEGHTVWDNHTPVEMIRKHAGPHRCSCGKEWES